MPRTISLQMNSPSDICKEHVKWGERQGEVRFTHHAFDHTSGPKRDYCFWCGVHRSGVGRRDDAGEFTEEDWNRDVEASIGKPIDTIMTEIRAFYDSLSPEARKKVCSFNPMGHPYPSLLT